MDGEEWQSDIGTDSGETEPSVHELLQRHRGKLVQADPYSIRHTNMRSYKDTQTGPVYMFLCVKLVRNNTHRIVFKVIITSLINHLPHVTLLTHRPSHF